MNKANNGARHCRNGLQCLAPVSCICLCPACRRPVKEVAWTRTCKGHYTATSTNALPLSVVRSMTGTWYAYVNHKNVGIKTSLKSAKRCAELSSVS